MTPTESEKVKVTDGLHMAFRHDPPSVRVFCPADEPRMYIPPHWHQFHDEYHRVFVGRLKVTYGRGRETRIVTPEDGDNFTPRGVVHSLESFDGEELVFEERTVPVDSDLKKEIFFRNLASENWARPDYLSYFQVFYHGDSYPSLPGGFKTFEKLLVTVVGGYVAPFLGYRIKHDHLKAS